MAMHCAEDDTHMVEDFHDQDQPPEEEIQQEDLFTEDKEPEPMQVDYMAMQEESPMGSTISASSLSSDYFAEDNTHTVEDFYDPDQPSEEEIQQDTMGT